MRSYKTTIIALVVLIAAIAAFFGVKHFLGDDETEEEAANSTYVSMFNISVDDVVKIRANNSEYFSLYKSEEEWYSDSHTELEIYTESVEDIIEDFSSLKGNIIKDFESLSDYSINEVSPYTELELSDGTVFRLVFGTTDSQASYRYVMIGGDEKTVYRIYESYAANLMMTRGLLIKLSAFDFSNEFNASHIKIQKKGEVLLEASGTFEPAETDDDEDTVKWAVKEPIVIDGNDEINTLISSLSNIALKELVTDTCDDLSEYGLDVPTIEYYLVFSDENGNTEAKSLKLGDKTADTLYYYCMADDVANRIYTIDAALLSTDVTAVSYIDPNVFYEMYNKLKTVDISFGGETHEMKFVFSGEDLSEEERYFDGQFARSDEYDEDYNTPEDKFNHLLAALYAIQIETVEPEEPENVGELLCKIVYNRIDGTSVTVECFKRDNSTCYIYEDGVYCGGYMRTSIRLYGDYTDYGVEGSLNALVEAMK